MTRRTGGLTVVCVLAIVLGALGLLTSLARMAAMVLGTKVQVAFGMPAGGDATAELQQEMNAQLMAVAERWTVVSWVIMGVTLIVASGLLAGGISSLMLKPFGRKLLFAAFIVGILFELARIGPTIMIALETQEVMSDHMPRLMASQGPAEQQAPEVKDFMTTTMQVVGVARALMYVALMLFKCGFYAYGAFYLSKPAIRALFRPEPGFEPI